MACNYAQLCPNDGLLLGGVAYCFGLLGCPGSAFVFTPQSLYSALGFCGDLGFRGFVARQALVTRI